MINNRQGGRRRGRGGGGRVPGSGPIGNRQDNRQRGNAAQLLEKYRGLARDAQMSGDRIQSEYYLQFADHYFRVLNENRPRFEEQRRGRDDEFDGDEDGDEDMIAGEGDEDGGEQRQERYERQDRPRRERFERGDRPERQARPERGDRPDRGERRDRPERTEQLETAEQPEREQAQGDEARPRRGRRPRTEGEANGGGEERLSLDILPPSISALVTEGETDAGAKPVRRRTRRAKPDEEVAPAA